MGRVHRYVAVFTLALVMALMPFRSGAESSACKRPELAWDKWLYFTVAANPGINHYELINKVRANILRAYGCQESDEACPPDQVVLLFCEDRTGILLAFVKDGCVTMAEDMPVRDFKAIVEGGEPL